MPEIPALSSDVLTDTDMAAAMLTETVDNTAVYSDAYQDVDASGVNEEDMTFHVDSGRYDSEEIEYIAEGVAVPARKGDRRSVKCERFKLAESYEITMEARNDSRVDEVQEEFQRKSERMANSIDYIAQQHLEEATQSNDHATVGAGSGGGPLTYDLLVDAALTEAGSTGESFAPGTVFVDRAGAADLMKTNEWTQATEAGEDTIRNGKIGSMAGLDVKVSTNPMTPDLGSGVAYVVDSRFLGKQPAGSHRTPGAVLTLNGWLML